MDTNFKRLLADATRLTRAGDLGAATEAIRRALGGKEPAAPEPDSRHDAGAAPVDPGATPAPVVDPTVIDGEWRRTDEAVSADAARPGGTERVGTNGSARSERVSDAPASDAVGVVSRARHEGRAGGLDYRLFVPPLAAGAAPPPLVVMLHGCTQDAEDFAVGTRMDALALEHGFLALYPEQSGRANPQRCWNWFKHVHQRRGRGEPGLIEETVRAITAAHGVNPDRVFVAGLSAGGAMAAILGSVCPGLFAAIGVHSGLAAGAAHDLPGALAAMRGAPGMPAGSLPTGRRADATIAAPTGRLPPTIVFHGDADHTVHQDNGERVIEACLASVPGAASVAPVIERNAGAGMERGWSRRVHRDAAGKLVAEHWLVHGAGHAWSGGDRRGSYADVTGPDASAEMARFFLAASDS